MDHKLRLKQFEAYAAARNVLAGAGLSVPQCPEEDVVNELEIKDTENGAVINLHGSIGWELDAREIARAIENIDAEKITVNINSPGGSLFGGACYCECFTQAFCGSYHCQ